MQYLCTPSHVKSIKFKWHAWWAESKSSVSIKKCFLVRAFSRFWDIISLPCLQRSREKIVKLLASGPLAVFEKKHIVYATTWRGCFYTPEIWRGAAWLMCPLPARIPALFTTQHALLTHSFLCCAYFYFNIRRNERQTNRPVGVSLGIPESIFEMQIRLHVI